MNELRVLVCGGRDYNKPERVSAALEMVWANSLGVLVVIEGGARGADADAAKWAEKHAAFGVIHEPYQADWKQYGLSAGPIRNTQMIEEGKPDLGIAFPGGRGTRNMVSQLKDAGIVVVGGEDINYVKEMVDSLAG